MKDYKLKQRNLRASHALIILIPLNIFVALELCLSSVDELRKSSRSGYSNSFEVLRKHLGMVVFKNSIDGLNVATLSKIAFWGRNFRTKR